MKMMIEDLKPCPFCGGEAHTELNFFSEYYSIVCEKCGMRTKDYISKSSAVIAWNRRPDGSIKDSHKQIFIVNGYGGVGKDTFVSCVRGCIDADTDEFSSIENIKHLARVAGWNEDKTEKGRKFLCDLKKLCKEYNDMPFQDLKNTVDDFKQSQNRFLFLYIREIDEIERAKEEFADKDTVVKTILVKNERVAPIASNDADANVSNYDYDVIIENNGTKDLLYDKAFKFSEDIINGKAEKCY